MCFSISASVLLQRPLNYSQAQTAVMVPGTQESTSELMYCISSYRTLFQRFFLLKPLAEDKAWRPWGDTKCWVTFQSFHDVYLIPHQKLAAPRKKTKKNKPEKIQPCIFFFRYFHNHIDSLVCCSDIRLSSNILLSPREKNNLTEQNKSLLDVHNQYSLLQVGIIMRVEYWFPIDAHLCCTDFFLFPDANCIS